MGDLASALSVVKDITLTIAGLTGTFVAAKGLNTWRRQLRGQNDFEVARKLLRSTYRYRDALRQARNPFMWVGETDPLPGEPDPPTERRQATEEERGYRRRLQAVSEIGRDLATDISEVEVLWGGNVLELARPLFKASFDLDTIIFVHLQRLRQGPDQPRPSAEEMREESRILYSTGGPDDLLTKQVEEAVQRIEALARRHLSA